LGVVRVPVIVGPTAAGKSAIALQLAREFEITIISADSRQLYRGFDIGTAKSTAAEQVAVPHRGIDIAEPGDRFNAARWARLAERWVDEVRREGRHPVVVGGTGFYLRALFQPLFDEPALDTDDREALALALEAMTTEELRARVLVVDPERAHLGRTQLLRALEVHGLTGQPISDWHRRATRPPRFAPAYLQVDAASTLAVRIERRVDRMLEEGWAGEVQQLVRSVPEGAPAWRATGYDTMRRAVAGELSMAAARTEVVIATRQYAKRQRTWCRTQLTGDITRIDSDAPDAVRRAIDWWSGKETK
jgi:tRNA dimethylallyltransferase